MHTVKSIVKLKMTWPLCLRQAAVRFYAEAQNMRHVARLFHVSLTFDLT